MDKAQIKPAMFGVVAGAVLMMMIGFGGLNWHLGRTVDAMVLEASQSATVAALSPICAANFQRAAMADAKLNTDLMDVSSWQRDNHLKDAGYATFPGTEANNKVAAACAALVTKDL